MDDDIPKEERDRVTRFLTVFGVVCMVLAFALIFTVLAFG